MDELESKVSFKRSVRILFRVYKFFGLVNFTYNLQTKRVQGSPQKRWKFIRALGYCWLSNLAFFVFVTCELNFSRFVKLEEILLTFRGISMISSASLLVFGYIKHRQTIVETLNRLIALSERVNRLTDNRSLYYPGSFRKFIVLRLLLFLAIGVVMLFSFDGIEGILSCVFYEYTVMLMELTFWAHLYGNLTLVCFYQKMNNLLNVLCARAREGKIKRNVREVISISYEIHRLKQTLNDVFSNFHLAYFLSFITDIHVVYDILRVLVVLELGKMHVPLRKVVGLVCQIIFGKCLTVQHLYLSSHIAEGLVQSDRLFRRRLLTMSYTHEVLRADSDQQREIESIVLRHSIQDLATRSWKLFVINHRFVCMFITEVVIFYAIVAFQQFVGEFVTASGKRLDVLRGSVVHTFEFIVQNDTAI